jgi:hypothetical protein
MLSRSEAGGGGGAPRLAFVGYAGAGTTTEPDLSVGGGPAGLAPCPYQSVGKACAVLGEVAETTTQDAGLASLASGVLYAGGANLLRPDRAALGLDLAITRCRSRHGVIDIGEAGLSSFLRLNMSDFRSPGERAPSSECEGLPRERAEEPVQAGSTPFANSACWLAWAQRKSAWVDGAMRLGSYFACGDLAHELSACE